MTRGWDPADGQGCPQGLPEKRCQGLRWALLAIGCRRGWPLPPAETGRAGVVVRGPRPAEGPGGG